MQIGMVGLGKMGGNMTSRLLKGGHGVVVFDRNQDAISKAESEGAKGAESLEDLVSQVKTPRVVWIMVPAGDPTESLLNELGELLSDGDTVIDGGNSNYKDTQRRATELEEKGISLVDVGTSGGGLGPCRRLQHDDWWRSIQGETTSTGLRNPRPWREQGLGSCRFQRRGSFCKNGP